MPLLQDMRTYLTASTSLGISASSSGTYRLFLMPFPETAPDAAVSVWEYGGRQSFRCMGPSLSAPVYEPVRFQVTVRNTIDNYETARALIGSIHDILDGLHETTLSTTRYLWIYAVDKPFSLGTDGQMEDSNERVRFVCNFEALKERG